MDTLVYILFRLLEIVVPVFPLGWWHFWANVYAVVFYYLIPVRKSVALKNLALAFGNERAAEFPAIIRGAYRNVFTVIFEFFYMRSLNSTKLNRLVKMTNSELIGSLLKRGKGLVIISAHFGNWELMAHGCARIAGVPFNVIVKEQTNTRLDKRLNEIRESAGNKMIEMKNALRETLRVLGSNGIIAMLGDQSAPSDGSVKVKFFGHDVPVFEGAAKFALKTDAAVVFGYPVREKDSSYTVMLIEIDTAKYSEYSEENIKLLTQEHTAMLENIIRQNPDHWLWFHKRFKSIINY